MDTTRKASGGSSLPRITVTAEDRERLPGPASAAMDRIPDLAGYLSDELDRAQVVRTGRSVLGFVRMGSEVEFRDDTTGRVQVVSLVYPGEVDIGQGRISVLTPVGAALLGLSKRQSIDWATRTGAAKRLTVLDVREPSSRADTDMPAPASLEERPPLVIPITDLRSRPGWRRISTEPRISRRRRFRRVWCPPTAAFSADFLARLAERGLCNITLVEGYSDDAPSGPFDAATCLLTLHFLEAAGRAATVRALRQRLKPGGPFVGRGRSGGGVTPLPLRPATCPTRGRWRRLRLPEVPSSDHPPVPS